MINRVKKGQRYELKVKDKYLKAGYAVMRGAASKWFNKLNDAKADLIAINPQIRIISLIQCKKGVISKKEKETILETLKSFEGRYQVITRLE